MRYLIINADDFGSCHAANQAVEDLFNNGFLTSTTLMPPCPWAEDAAMRAAENPRIHLGLHLTTTGEYHRCPWRPVTRDTPSLTDERGYLWPRAEENLSHARPEEMERELSAQLDWMEKRGVSPDHLDSHMGTVYGIYGPSYLETAFSLCLKAGGVGFRLPRRIIPPFEEMEGVLEKAVAAADGLGVFLPQTIFTVDDLPQSYEDLREQYLSMIRRIPEGVSEMFLHPCVDTPEVRALNGWWEKRFWEYRLMLDDRVKAVIDGEGIRLISWREALSVGQDR